MEAVYAFIDSILPFGWLQYDFMKNALIAVLLIAPLLGILGTMAVNNNMAFFSDAIGHSAITGIALGVLLGMNNYLLSTLAFAVLIAFAITSVKRSSMSSTDTIISVFFFRRDSSRSCDTFPRRRLCALFVLSCGRYPQRIKERYTFAAYRVRRHHRHLGAHLQ